MKKLFAIILLLGLGSYAYASFEKIETLLGFYEARSGVFIRVESGGCTWKQSFEARLSENRGIPQLTFVRVIPDNCLAYYYDGKVLYYTYEELGLKKGEHYELVNPIEEQQ